MSQALRPAMRKARPQLWSPSAAMEVDDNGDDDDDDDGDGDTTKKRAMDEPVMSNDAKRRKVEEDRENAVNVAHAINDVELGSGKWSVSE